MEDGLDERENILERFSLAGLYPQQGTTMEKESKLVFGRWQKGN